MSDSNRGKRPATWLGRAVGLIGIAVAIYAIIYGLSEQRRYLEEANQAAPEYSRNAAYKAYEACRVSPLTKLGECLANAKREYQLERNDNARDYADLVAQQRSALWTGIVGVTAIFGVILSIVGVGLVFTTFRETRRAADAAHEANRPWLDIEICDVGHLEIDDGELTMTFTAKIHNRGNSPALKVQHRGSLAAQTTSLLGYNRACARYEVEELLLEASVIGLLEGACVFPGASPKVPYVARLGPENIDRRRAETNEFRICFAFGVHYRFGDREGHTIVSFDLYTSDKGVVFSIPLQGRRLLEVKLHDNFSSEAS